MSNEALITFCNVGIWLFGVASLSCALGSYYFGKQLETETKAVAATSGLLIPKVAQQDTVKRGQEKSKPNPAMSAGKNGGEFSFGAAGAGFNLGEDIGLVVALPNGSLSVSIIIRDKFGKIIGELHENEWELNINNYLKRNYDKSALEIIDQNGEVVFQVDLVENVTRIQYKLRNKAGGGVAFVEAEQGGTYVIFRNPGEDFDFMIKPMFKYPSDKYLGMRVQSTP